MDCCATLNKVFDQKRARRDRERYLKNGLDRPARLLVETLRPHLAGLSVLDAGCGVGALTLELAGAGAAKALGIDVSDSSIREAADLGTEKRIRHAAFRTADIVMAGPEIPRADVVVSSRVICCYPDMAAFLTATASRTTRFYGIIAPRDNPLMRLGAAILNGLLPFTRYRGFRFHIHSITGMHRIITSSGFSPMFRRKKGFWDVAVFEKNRRG